MQGWDVGGAVQSWGLDLRILVGLFLLCCDSMVL